MEYYHWIILLVCLFIYHMYLLSGFDNLNSLIGSTKDEIYTSIRSINESIRSMGYRLDTLRTLLDSQANLISYLEHRDMATALILEYNQKHMELHKYSGKHYYFDRATANILCTISFEEERQESYTVREFENQILNPLRLAHAKSQLEKCKANCPDWQLEPVPDLGCHVDTYVNHTTVPSRKKPRKSRRK